MFKLILIAAAFCLLIFSVVRMLYKTFLAAMIRSELGQASRRGADTATAAEAIVPERQRQLKTRAVALAVIFPVAVGALIFYLFMRML